MSYVLHESEGAGPPSNFVGGGNNVQHTRLYVPCTVLAQ